MKKILVIEDTAAIREEIADILEMEGFQVFEAADGLEGLNKAKTIIPDLIVSDILMPKLNGYQMLKELQKQYTTENIPLIFLSAKAEKSDIREGMNLGADDYLTKPLSADDLIKAINNKLTKQELFNKKIDELRINISRSFPHELRTPLHGILGFSSILKDITDTPDRDYVIKMASAIYESGKRLHHIVENYLLFSMLLGEANDPAKKERNEPPIDTKDIIEQTVRKTGEEENRMPDIIMNLSEFKLAINGNDLSKIIEELISNGIKFSTPGEKIEISTGRENQSCFISFRNEGTGMSEENVAKIGGFMQFDRESKEQQGLGLGLCIVKLLTLIYKGDIEIDSKPEKYFSIKLRFPQR
jgi:two-component system sensor histidine kinase/response regulator